MKIRTKNHILLPALIAGLGLVPVGQVMAQTFTNLHSFSFGSDGANPYPGLVLSGNTLYGTANRGGSGYGTVFKVNTNGTGFTNLHSFANDSDGAYPEAGLIISGNTLYGTASAGNLGRGTVFKVNTDGTGFAALHVFTNGGDGNYPYSGLILSGNTLFGTTSEGGGSGNGTVFAVNTDGTGFTNLHSFTAGSGFPPVNSEGAFPYAGLILSGDTLFGTALYGGSSGKGTVFAVKINGTGFTNLHSFTYGSDGGNPRAGLILSGNTLYGTAYQGGSSNNGTLFAVKTDGSAFTTLYSFTGLSDGGYPYSGLILSGNTLYGTAERGGSDSGAVFAVRTDGTGFTSLHSFSALVSDTNSDGATPRAGLILSGNTLYGAAYYGGSLGNGTIFSISLPVPPNHAPTVANPIPDTNSAYGRPFNFTFAANIFSDPDAGQALSYSASGLPPGIAFDGASRTFSGTPTNVGLYAVTVTATDNGTPPLSTNATFAFQIIQLLVVTNLADSGPGTLRQAIADATTGSRIEFAVSGTIVLSARLDITNSLTVAGPGATNLAVAGHGNRIFNVSAGPTVISGLTLSSGWDLDDATSGGGAIHNSAALTLSSCALIQNQSFFVGGAVMNTGGSATLVVTDCTFSENYTSYYNGSGGAIWNDNILRITNSTFIANLATVSGGAVDSSGDAVIASSTIVGSSVFFGSGGGIYNDGGTFKLQNSIVAASSTFFYGEQDVAGIISGDYNLIQNTNGAVVPGTHNIIGLDPLLSPLRDNGGPTRTCGLASTSPALNAADAATCPPRDQRGVSRPQDGGCDIGAFEGSLPLNHPPTIANPIPDITAHYRDMVNYTIPANTFADSDPGQALTYSLIDPSQSFSLDPVSGTVSGNIYSVGAITTGVVATDDGAPPLSVTNYFRIVSAKRQITASANDYSRPLGSSNQAFTITYYGLLDPVGTIDNPPLATTSATAGSPAGAYDIVLTGGSDDLYEFTSLTNGTLTILDFSVDYRVVHPFGFTNLMGRAPEAPMIEGSDGILYGTTGEGVFRINQDGTGYQLLVHFGMVNNNASRSLSGVAEGDDGYLYGTTFDGGSLGFGSIFKVNRDGTDYSLLYSFAGGNLDTDSPTDLLQATNGVLYGLTRGAFGGGKPALFKINTNGSGYSILHEFDYAAEGDQPAGLFQSKDGKLYGTTGEDQIGSGVVFRTELTNGGFTIIYPFDFGLFATVREASDGILYGANRFGGVVFSLNRDGSGYTNLHEFGSAGDGSYPFDSVIEGPDHALYGTTYYGGTGFAGTIFKLEKDGTNYGVLHQCQFDDGGPRSLLTRLTSGSAGKVHGVSAYGGTLDQGCLFNIDPVSGNLAITWSFNGTGGDGAAPDFRGPNQLLEGTDHKLYGVTAAGGSVNRGAIFAMNKDGSGYALLHNFTGLGGEGDSPTAGLIEGQDGELYGSTPTDRTNYAGALFRISKDGSVFTVLHAFGAGFPGDGATPAGTLVQDTNGVLYGVTRGGGTNYGGTLFSINTNGTDFSILYHFGYPNGVNPSGLMLGRDGLLYVSLEFGGSVYGGQLVMLGRDGTGMTLLHDFIGSDGAIPEAAVIQASDNLLYGVTSSGGTQGRGVIFSVSTNGSGFQIVRNLGLGASDAAGPYYPLMEGNDGALYGATSMGGIHNLGTIFRLKRNGSEYSVIEDFAGRDGASPVSALTLASDGALYGMSSGGGVTGLGVVFRLGVIANQPPNVNAPISDQNAIYGSAFSFTIPSETFSDPDAGQTLHYTASGTPPGISLDGTTGTFSGTNGAIGAFAVMVTATDSGMPPMSTNTAFVLHVLPTPLVVTANNQTRPYGQANPALTGTLTGVTNGDNITASFATVATPASPAGPYPITPLLSDPNNRLPNYVITTNIGTLTVNCSALAITNAILSSATKGTAYSITLRASNGPAPFIFALTGGTLPGNITLNSNGLLSGTPTNIGSSQITITATSADGCMVSSNYALAVVCPAITLSPTALSDVIRNTFYSPTITASGGTAPRTFAVTSGRVPDGMSLASGGLLSGAPTNVGTYSFTITATDASGCTGSRDYTMHILCQPLTISPATLPQATLGVPYAQSLMGSNGTGPYTFTLSGGALPLGLTLSASGGVSGVPTNTGISFFTVTTMDSSNCSGSISYSVLVGTTRPMITARKSHTATVLANGTTLAAGGYAGNGAAIASAEIYDPATGTWTATGSMLATRGEHTATLLPNGKVLVVGGYGDGYLASAELYDPATGTWTATSGLATQRYSHTATLLVNGKVLVTGGYCGCSFNDDFSEIYDPATGTWTGAAGLNTRRWYHTATLLPNGKVLVSGGYGSGTFTSIASAEIYDPAGSAVWTATGSLLATLAEHTATLLPNGKVLVAGGFSSSGAIPELYDPTSGTWTTTGSPNSGGQNRTATLLPNGKLLVTGGGSGSSFSSSAELYDPASGTWTLTVALGTARRSHTATLLANGKVLLAGGVNAGGLLSSAEIYEIPNGTWTTIGSLTNSRSGHTATFLPNGKVLVAGGGNNSGVTNITEVYDPATGTWTTNRPMVTSRQGHTATLLPNGKVLVAGGSDPYRGTFSSAELFDSVSGTWTNTGALIKARQGHTATLLANGKVLLTGGFDGSFNTLSGMELYDPALGTWTTNSPMITARNSHTATLLPNGRVLVIGGADNSGNSLFSAESYDPNTRIWVTNNPMVTARQGHTATLLPNGQVLVAGGYIIGPGALASTELFDPASGTWIANGALNAARYVHSATLLQNGKVLVAGGQNPFTFPSNLASAELYDPANRTWITNSPMAIARQGQTATLLANGKVLIAGGNNNISGSLSSAVLYDVGLGFNAAWQPQIATFTSPLISGSNMTITGSHFRGVSGGSSGNSQDSPGDYPVVQLRSVEGGQTIFLPPMNWSTNSFVSAPALGFPVGYALLTVFVNAIPSGSSLVAVSPPSPVPLQRVTSGGSTTLCWPTNAINFVAECTDSLSPPVVWQTVTNSISVTGTNNCFTVTPVPAVPRRFYRLRLP